MKLPSASLFCGFAAGSPVDGAVVVVDGVVVVVVVAAESVSRVVGGAEVESVVLLGVVTVGAAVGGFVIPGMPMLE